MNDSTPAVGAPVEPSVRPHEQIEERVRFEHCDAHTGTEIQGLSCKLIRNDDGTAATQEQIWALLERLQAENLRLHAAAEKARDRFQRIVDEPSNTMSDAKALREILRQAKLGLAGA